MSAPAYSNLSRNAFQGIKNLHGYTPFKGTKHTTPGAGANITSTAYLFKNAEISEDKGLPLAGAAETRSSFYGGQIGSM